MNELTIIEQQELEHEESAIERNIAHIKENFIDIGERLERIRQKSLYKSYGTWEHYLRTRWNMSDEYARLLRKGTEVIKNLSPTLVGVLPTTERQVRPLTELPKEEQPAVWQRAVETAPNGKVTGDHVRRVVNEHMGRATQLKREYERLSREEGIQPESVLIKADTEWGLLPEVSELIKRLDLIAWELIPSINRAAELGKTSPEARSFIARRMRLLAEKLIANAEQLETRHD